MNLLKGVFNKDKEQKNEGNNERTTARIVLQNDHLEIVQQACKECYKGKLIDNNPAKAKYIQSKVKVGHESVLEHSNIVIDIVTGKSNYEQLIKMLSSNHYLNTLLEVDDTTYNILLGGSIRGYKELIRATADYTSPIMKEIINCLYQLDKEYFYDFINDGIMFEDMFLPIDEIDYTREQLHPYNLHNSKMDVINVDDVIQLYHNSGDKYYVYDLLKFITITVHFTGMSRVITQQLTRHRNAISQRSQRYVKEADTPYINPLDYKKEEYLAKFTREGLTEEESNEKFDTLKDKFDGYATIVMDMYKQLSDEGLLNEDARGILPNCTESSLFVTFKGTTLAKFLELRTDKHAQAEIRKAFAVPLLKVMEHIFASIIGEEFIDGKCEDKTIQEYIELLLSPEYMYVFCDEYNDEVLEENSESISIDDFRTLALGEVDVEVGTNESKEV